MWIFYIIYNFFNCTAIELVPSNPHPNSTTDSFLLLPLWRLIDFLIASSLFPLTYSTKRHQS